MQIKLIIWDLDDTLWRGTLADGEAVSLIESRAALVRAFNARGVVSALCSKNDFAAARDKLEAMGLWEEFVFPHIAFTPKAEAVRGIIADMQLRPANTLFVDDNPHNLEAVRHLLPDVHGLNASAPDADSILEALLAAQPGNARSRLADYRLLETKARDRVAGDLSNEAFLRQSGITACAPFLMDNLDFVPRIVDLVNRSNQLNYTQSRLDPTWLTEAIIAVPLYDSWSIFAWDRYGDYGLVGFVMVDRVGKRLMHFAFSCRVMHMGLENYAISKIREKWPDCDLSMLDDRVADMSAHWITDQSFDDPAIRQRLIAQLRPESGGYKDVRIMFDCQSGGIAHFSRHRARIDFDNSPRVFSLRHVISEPDGGDLGDAPTLVYGAGVDYSDPRWPDLVDLLEDEGLFEGCVHLLCERVALERRHMLVILPAEDAPERLYRPHMGHTRVRTVAFNALWRHAASVYPGIEVFEMTGFARTEEMSDISHYHPAFLRRLAGLLDGWIDYGRLPAASTARLRRLA
ncbi:hypothetical protein BH10PSE13_BH10PSE13_02010 [soil metagenome]